MSDIMMAMDNYLKSYFAQIKNTYALIWPELKKKYPRWDPYAITSFIHFSPIEQNVWEDIRRLNLPFLPQYPSYGYFIDFADPFKRLALEIDGKDYHQDKEKDDKRESFLKSKGWRVFRITGSETCFRFADYAYSEMNDTDLESASYRTLKHLKEDYYSEL